MKLLLIICVALLTMVVTTNYAVAYDDTLWTSLEMRSDVEIKIENGKKKAYFSSGVVISEDGSGVDNSGLGAVMCGWMIYAHTYSALKACDENRYKNYINAYGRAVDRIEGFVVENSLVPVSKLDIEENRKAMFNMSFLNQTKNQICASEFIPKGDEDLSEELQTQFEKRVDKMLSVPRPPVSEPCI